jgi:hypothetical protein
MSRTFWSLVTLAWRRPFARLRIRSASGKASNAKHNFARALHGYHTHRRWTSASATPSPPPSPPPLLPPLPLSPPPPPPSRTDRATQLLRPPRHRHAGTFHPHSEHLLAAPHPNGDSPWTTSRPRPRDALPLQHSTPNARAEIRHGDEKRARVRDHPILPEMAVFEYVCVISVCSVLFRRQDCVHVCVSLCHVVGIARVSNFVYSSATHSGRSRMSHMSGGRAGHGRARARYSVGQKRAQLRVRDCVRLTALADTT